MTSSITTILPDGTTSVEETETPPTLDWCKEQVGGWVEKIPSQGPNQILANEDGKPLGLEFNPKASELAGRPLVGTVIILEGKARLK